MSETPIIESLIAHLENDEYPDVGVMRSRKDRANRARAELAALRERVAKLEAALVKADEASASADKVTSVPQYNQIANVFSLAEWRISELSEAMIAYRTAREATK